MTTGLLRSEVAQYSVPDKKKIQHVEISNTEINTLAKTHQKYISTRYLKRYGMLFLEIFFAISKFTPIYFENF